MKDRNDLKYVIGKLLASAGVNVTAIEPAAGECSAAATAPAATSFPCPCALPREPPFSLADATRPASEVRRILAETSCGVGARGAAHNDLRHLRRHGARRLVLRGGVLRACEAEASPAEAAAAALLQHFGVAAASPPPLSPERRRQRRQQQQRQEDATPLLTAPSMPLRPRETQKQTPWRQQRQLLRSRCGGGGDDGVHAATNNNAASWECDSDAGGGVVAAAAPSAATTTRGRQRGVVHRRVSASPQPGSFEAHRCLEEELVATVDEPPSDEDEDEGAEVTVVVLAAPVAAPPPTTAATIAASRQQLRAGVQPKQSAVVSAASVSPVQATATAAAAAAAPAATAGKPSTKCLRRPVSQPTPPPPPPTASASTSTKKKAADDAGQQRAAVRAFRARRRPALPTAALRRRLRRRHSVAHGSNGRRRRQSEVEAAAADEDLRPWGAGGGFEDVSGYGAAALVRRVLEDAYDPWADYQRLAATELAAPAAAIVALLVATCEDVAERLRKAAAAAASAASRAAAAAAAAAAEQGEERPLTPVPYFACVVSRSNSPHPEAAALESEAAAVAALVRERQQAGDAAYAEAGEALPLAPPPQDTQRSVTTTPALLGDGFTAVEEEASAAAAAAAEEFADPVERAVNAGVSAAATLWVHSRAHTPEIRGGGGSCSGSCSCSSGSASASSDEQRSSGRRRARRRLVRSVVPCFWRRPAAAAAASARAREKLCRIAAARRSPSPPCPARRGDGAANGYVTVRSVTPVEAPALRRRAQLPASFPNAAYVFHVGGQQQQHGTATEGRRAKRRKQRVVRRLRTVGPLTIVSHQLREEDAGSPPCDGGVPAAAEPQRGSSGRASVVMPYAGGDDDAAGADAEYGYCFGHDATDEEDAAAESAAEDAATRAEEEDDDEEGSEASSELQIIDSRPVTVAVVPSSPSPPPPASPPPPPPPPLPPPAPSQTTVENTVCKRANPVPPPPVSRPSVSPEGHHHPHAPRRVLLRRRPCGTQNSPDAAAAVADRACTRYAYDAAANVWTAVEVRATLDMRTRPRLRALLLGRRVHGYTEAHRPDAAFAASFVHAGADAGDDAEAHLQPAPTDAVDATLRTVSLLKLRHYLDVVCYSVAAMYGRAFAADRAASATCPARLRALTFTRCYLAEVDESLYCRLDAPDPYAEAEAAGGDPDGLLSGERCADGSYRLWRDVAAKGGRSAAGKCGPQPDPAHHKVEELLDCFAHYTFVRSRHTVMAFVTKFVRTTAVEARLALCGTEAAVHASLLPPEECSGGSGAKQAGAASFMGRSEVHRFFARHQCGSLCKVLRLPETKHYAAQVVQQGRRRR